MADHYKRVRGVANTLSEWINDPERPSWTSYCRKTRLKFGVGKNFVLRILDEDYPNLAIENDQLVRAEDGAALR